MEPTVEAGVGEGTTPELAPVVQIDEGRIQANLDHVLCVCNCRGDVVRIAGWRPLKVIRYHQNRTPKPSGF